MDSHYMLENINQKKYVNTVLTTICLSQWYIHSHKENMLIVNWLY